MELILTNEGEQLASAGFITGVFPKITKVVFGDGGGSIVIPVPELTALVNPVYTGVGTVAVARSIPNGFAIYTSIPMGVGGFTIREIGLFTENDELVAIGGNIEQYKRSYSEYPEKLDFYLTVNLSSSQNFTVNFTNDNIYASQGSVDVLADEINNMVQTPIACQTVIGDYSVSNKKKSLGFDVFTYTGQNTTINGSYYTGSGGVFDYTVDTLRYGDFFWNNTGSTQNVTCYDVFNLTTRVISVDDQNGLLNIGMVTIDLTNKAQCQATGLPVYHARQIGDCIMAEIDDLYLNGTFDTDTVWIKGIGWSISAGVATHSGTTASNIEQSIATEIGKKYIIKYRLLGTAGNNHFAYTDSGTPVVDYPALTAGTYTFVFTATATTTNVGIGCAFSANASFDDFEVVGLVESGYIDFSDYGIDGICSIHDKGRTNTYHNNIYDGLRGVYKALYTSNTNIEGIETNSLSGFKGGAITLGVNVNLNQLNATYVATVVLYNKLSWGLTNHSERYIECYNNYTKAYMPMWIGSGDIGHRLPNSMGVELSMLACKRITTSTSGWQTFYGDLSYYLEMQSTAARTSSTNMFISNTDTYIELGSDNNNIVNTTNIGYGFANSKNRLLIPFTGNAGTNILTIKDIDGIPRRVSRVLFKSVIGTTGNWAVYDYKRGGTSMDVEIFLNLPDIENTNVNAVNQIISNELGVLTLGYGGFNAAGVEYLAIIDLATEDEAPSGSYYDAITALSKPRLENGIIYFNNGYDTPKIHSRAVFNGDIIPSNGWED